MRISELFLYPIKSLQGVSVKEAEVLERGFRFDRRWMIVDEDNVCITQRTHPELSQISVALTSDEIVLSGKDSEIELPVNIQSSQVEVTVWSDKVVAQKADDIFNEWISSFLGQKCAFVFMPEDGSRPANPERAKNQENVSFADGYPYLIIGETSLEDLNTRLASSVPMNRFRPNIVVSGSKPYEEDLWKDLQIGEVKFYGTHPCKRCVFTTIDQETGKKGVEPLKTLATYRRQGNEIYFGLNVLATSEGKVKVEDTLVLSKDSTSDNAI